MCSRRTEAHCLGSPGTFLQLEEILGSPRAVERIVGAGCCVRRGGPGPGEPGGPGEEGRAEGGAGGAAEGGPGGALLVEHYRVAWTIKRAIREWQLRLWGLSPDLAPPQRLPEALSEAAMRTARRDIRPLLRVLDAGALRPLEARRLLACLAAAREGRDPEAEYQLLCRGDGDWVFGVGAVDARPLAYRDRLAESRFSSWLRHPVAVRYLRAFRTVLEVVRELSAPGAVGGRGGC